MSQVLEGYMTTKQAAEYLGYDPDYICNLCINKKLSGAGKFGNAWAIPEQSVYNYKPGLQGQAAINARKQAEMDMWLAVARETAAQKKEAERA